MIKNNTVAFTWKYDSFVQSMPAAAIGFDKSVNAEVINNVFAMSDRFAVDNIKKASLLLKDNLLIGATEGDYIEFNTIISASSLEDEADYLKEGSSNNTNQGLALSINPEWASLYASRVLLDRNIIEENVSADKSSLNSLRGLLGLPLQAGTVKTKQSPVWMHVMSVNDAVALGEKKYLNKYGSQI